MMPIPTFCKECTHLQAGGDAWPMCRDTLDSKYWLGDGAFSAAYLDTRGSLDCNSTFGQATLKQTSTLVPSAIQCFDEANITADNMRAIVNIHITADSVIRTHVSLYGTEQQNSSDDTIHRLMPLSDELADSSSSPILSATAHSLHNPNTKSRKNKRLLTTEECSLRRSLYSVDPLVFSDVCEPLALWIADHIWKVTTQGLSLPLAFVGLVPCAMLPKDPLPVLAESINSLLMSTLLQPSAIILSLFYIAHLPAYIGTVPFHSLSSASANRFNKLLLSSDSIAQDGPVVQALYSTFKLFVLGAILSNKILDDHVFTMKTWHDVSGVPLKVLNELEWLSLDILSHELLLDSATWADWVQTLHSYHLSSHSHSTSDSPNSNSYTVVKYMLEDLLPQDEFDDTRSEFMNTHVHAPTFLGIQDRIASRQSEQESRANNLDGYEMDDDGPLREEYLPRRRFKSLLPDSSPDQETGFHGQPRCVPEIQSVYSGSWNFSANAVPPRIDVTNQFPNSSSYSVAACYTSVFGNDQDYPKVASTLCDYFLSHSRVRVY